MKSLGKYTFDLSNTHDFLLGHLSQLIKEVIMRHFHIHGLILINIDVLNHVLDFSVDFESLSLCRRDMATFLLSKLLFVIVNTKFHHSVILFFILIGKNIITHSIRVVPNLKFYFLIH